MNILSMKKKDYLEKNTILMIVYATAATLGGMAQFAQDRPIGLALALIIPAFVALIVYFIQRKVSQLQIAFPYFVVLCGLINVYGCIETYNVTLSTIVLSFFVILP